MLTPADNGVVSTASPSLTGTAPANASVTVLVDGAIACVTTATASGTFSCTPGAPLSAGRHLVFATIPGADAGTLVSNTNTFQVDVAAPLAPVVTSPKDGATTDSKPLILGTAEPLSVVSITIDGAVVGTVTADANGSFSFALSTALADGTHTVSAKSADRAGNASPASATNTFTVVTSTGSGVVLLTPPNGALLSTATPALSGTTTPGAQVEAKVDGAVVCTATATASGAWSCTPATALAEGTHLATANLVGSSTASNTNAFIIDTKAPTAPVVTSPTSGGSAGSTPVLTGTAEPGTTVTVTIDGVPVCVTGVDAQGNWSCTPGTPLTPGAHTIGVVATDPAGNVSTPSTPVTFTVDTTPPAAPVLTAPADGSSTQDSKPAFTGTAEKDAQVTVFVDGKPVCTAKADASGAFTCTPAAPLTVGAHSAIAVATDSAGNASPSSNANAFTVTPGPATLTAPKDGALLDTATPTFTGTAPPNSTVTGHRGDEDDLHRHRRRDGRLVVHAGDAARRGRARRGGHGLGRRDGRAELGVGRVHRRHGGAGGVAERRTGRGVHLARRALHRLGQRGERHLRVQPRRRGVHSVHGGHRPHRPRAGRPHAGGARHGPGGELRHGAGRLDRRRAGADRHVHGRRVRVHQRGRLGALGVRRAGAGASSVAEAAGSSGVKACAGGPAGNRRSRRR